MHSSSYMPPPAQHSPGNNTWNNDSYPTVMMMTTSHEIDCERDAEKPLDLSLRAPRQDSWPARSSSPYYYKPYCTSARPSKSSSEFHPSSHLSPHPFSSTSPSPARHRGSPCLITHSRSPLTRPVSPYYNHYRQTPSPYYNYLTGSCTPPENSTPIQVLSSTNRLLNGLPSTPTSHFRSFEDTTSQDVTNSESSRIKQEGVTEHRRDQENVELEADEPTYIDMDSSTTVSSRQISYSQGSSSFPVYTSSREPVPPQKPAGLSYMTSDRTAPGTSHHGYGQIPSSLCISSAHSSMPTVESITRSSLSPTSVQISAAPDSRHSLPSSSSYPHHVCDSSLLPTTSNPNHVNPFFKIQENDSMVTEVVSTTNIALSQSPPDDAMDTNHHQHYHHLSQETKHQHNPDSSSSPSSNDGSIKVSSSNRSFEPTVDQVESTSSSTSSRVNTNSHQGRPEAYKPPAYTQSPSNKENVSTISSVRVVDQTSAASSTPRRSFFQIDKSMIGKNNAAMFSDQQIQNDNPGRLSILDFWISKILMEETPRRRCSADIRQTVDGNRRIRLRLVDLIELQVEQSLKA